MAGIGDFRIGLCAYACGHDTDGPPEVVHIELHNPEGTTQPLAIHSHVQPLHMFLKQTYAFVPYGRESEFIDYETELANLLA
jgi:hypothetical protein